MGKQDEHYADKKIKSARNSSELREANEMMARAKEDTRHSSERLEEK